MTSLISNLTGRRLAAVVGDFLETLPWWSSRRDVEDAVPVGATDLVRTVEALLSRRGEASGVMLARLVLEGYRAASAEQKTAFLVALSAFFGVDEEALAAAANTFVAARSAETAQALRDASRPRHLEVLRRLNLAPGGTEALVRMREDLLDLLKDHPGLKGLDDDFARLFATWFNRGFLTLGPIDWTTSAAILEKIIRYEAVHVISGWDDLRNRLAPTDRRYFAFFHPGLPDEPLIFVEVALTTSIPDAIGPLLDLTRAPIEAERANVAVFYSISNTQRGLAGVSFGNFLIKQVVEDLRHALPDLDTFVTLSPVPGFARWLARERGDEASRFVPAADRAVLARLDEPDWHLDPAAVEAVRGPMLAAAARYFLEARRPGGGLVDPVARFHLGNGARLERLNFLGDRSPQGLAQSHGLMVNYLYDLGDIERHHEAFFEHDRVAASAAVTKAMGG